MNTAQWLSMNVIHKPIFFRGWTLSSCVYLNLKTKHGGYKLKFNSECVCSFCRAETKCLMVDEQFLAPEQRYTVEYCIKHKRRQEATTKSDVWKIPHLVNQILTAQSDLYMDEVLTVKRHLKKLHRFCQATNPINRWSSLKLLREYQLVYREIYGSQ